MTELLGVLGDPIAQSLSPLIHNAWLREAGIDATYEAMQVAENDFASALETLAKRQVRGLNITLPHKHAALVAAGEVSVSAAKIGAANTLTPIDGGGWHADNTDAPGFLFALAHAGIEVVENQNILVLGAGGAARAVVYALHQRGASLTILNRTPSRAADLSKQLTNGQSAYGPIDQYRDYLDEACIVINTTSMGYTGNAIELARGKNRLFADISYGRIAAAQLAHADQQGWRTLDGLSMLVAQAAESFEIWFGGRPDTDKALQRVRRVVEAVS